MAYNAALGYDPDKDYTVDALKQQLTSLATQLQEKAGATGSYTYKDFTNTDDYANLKSRYEYSGQRAAKDTLGQVAARTGGMASSYAQSAAQQGYNDWMARLYDVAQDSYTSEYNKWWNRRGEAQDRIKSFLEAGGDYGSLDEALVGQSGYTTPELSALQSYYAKLLAQQFAPAAPQYIYVGGGSSGSDSESGSGITNRYGGTSRANPDNPAWVQVGGGRISYDSFVNKVNNGTIVGNTNKNGTTTYSYAPKSASSYDPTIKYKTDYENYKKKNTGAR